MKRFTKPIRSNLKKASIVIVGVLMIGGVAFALLQSQAKLTGNSISTGTTGLQISQNDTTYATSTTGYNFNGIIPGGQPSQAERVFLKNTGTLPLALKLAVASPPTNPGNVDLNKVKIVLTPYSKPPQTFSLQSLIDSSVSGGLSISYPDKLPISSRMEFNVQVAMDADAVSGSSASLSNLDLAFTGIAAAN